MLIKANLLFRECKPYTNSDGVPFLRCRFLDDIDQSYTFFFEDTKENERFKNMKRDTPCDLNLVIYKSTENKGKYNMYCNM